MSRHPLLAGLFGTLASSLAAQCFTATAQPITDPANHNPAALVTVQSAGCSPRPILGSFWCLAILHGSTTGGFFMPNAIFDFYVISIDVNPSPFQLAPFGWVLINQSLVLGTFTSAVIPVPLSSASRSDFSIQLPTDVSMCGLPLMVQGGGFDGTIRLTSGMLGTIGT